ncbi:D-aminopeptidase [Alphaproteobacteria bacterium SO-S41]|nr:D-aminopeptidase [Alphaproteobacteria bacterium SO-S41]
MMPDQPLGARQAAFEKGLLPIVRIADEDTRWTVDERLAHYKCPAVGVAAIKDGRLDWAAGYGVRGREDPRPVNADTIFMLASCSKPVCAMVVLQQVERGLVDLDVDVNKYLKRWQIPQNEFTSGETVTLRRMLSHTAGLSINGWPVIPHGGQIPTIYDILEGRPPSIHPAVVVNKPPGGTHRYSGGGFLLAEMLIEDQTGRKFDELADELIFGPLGMANTTFTHPLPERLRGNVAGGHRMDGSAIPGGWMISVDKGAGGIMGSAADFATFQIACRDAWLGKPGAILTQSLAKEMMTPQANSTFGLGWGLSGSGATLRFRHGGSNDGYQSETTCYLESGDGGVAITNAVSGIFLYNEVLNGLADLYDWPGYLPPPRRARPLTVAEQERYIGTYTIVSGVEMPYLRIWRDGGRLLSDIPGMRVGIRETFIDEDGIMFNRMQPSGTQVTYGADGRANELLSVRADGTPMIRAVRTTDSLHA